MNWLGAPAAVYAVATAALLGLAADGLRSVIPSVAEWVRTVFGSMMRAEERSSTTRRTRVNGATNILIGATIVALVFPLGTSVTVLTMTILADAAAAIVGRGWGRHAWGPLGTTVEGTMAFVGTGTVVMYIDGSIPPGPAAAGVVGAAIAEAVPLPIEDNVYVPFVAATLMVATDALA